MTGRHRHTLRLSGCDYTAAGVYHVTLVTHERACLFGEIIEGVMRLNPVGRVVEAEWRRLPARFPGLRLDALAIMPNHLHGILILKGQPLAEGKSHPNGPPPGSLGAIIGQFKAHVSRRLNQSEGMWQRNYYDHIIRDDEDLERVRQYILDNPAQWDSDEEHPM